MLDSLTRGRLVAAALALAFLAGAVGYVIGTRTSDSAPGRDSVEVGFLYDMIHHHEQALEMSSLDLTNGTEPRVLHFAKEITQQQSFEIGVMQQILRDWGHDPDDPPKQSMAWTGEPVAHHEMQGMASAAEIDALADSQGRAADELFLRLMIAHHRGGAQMAAFASERSDDAQVKDLATRMSRIQQLEIGEMTDAGENLGLDVSSGAPGNESADEPQQDDGHDH